MKVQGQAIWIYAYFGELVKASWYHDSEIWSYESFEFSLYFISIHFFICSLEIKVIDLSCFIAIANFIDAIMPIMPIDIYQIY